MLSIIQHFVGILQIRVAPGNMNYSNYNRMFRMWLHYGTWRHLCCWVWMLKKLCPDFTAEAPFLSFCFLFFLFFPSMLKKTWCSDRKEQVQPRASAFIWTSRKIKTAGTYTAYMPQHYWHSQKLEGLLLKQALAKEKKWLPFLSAVFFPKVSCYVILMFTLKSHKT